MEKLRLSRDKKMDLGQLLAMLAKTELTLSKASSRAVVTMQRLSKLAENIFGFDLTDSSKAIYKRIREEANQELAVQGSPVRLSYDFTNKNFPIEEINQEKKFNDDEFMDIGQLLTMLAKSDRKNSHGDNQIRISMKRLIELAWDAIAFDLTRCDKATYRRILKETNRELDAQSSRIRINYDFPNQSFPVRLLQPR